MKNSIHDKKKYSVIRLVMLGSFAREGRIGSIISSIFKLWLPYYSPSTMAPLHKTSIDYGKFLVWSGLAYYWFQNHLDPRFFHLIQKRYNTRQTNNDKVKTLYYVHNSY